MKIKKEKKIHPKTYQLTSKSIKKLTDDRPTNQQTNQPTDIAAYRVAQHATKNYIGQTERTVRERCGDYRRAINTQNFSQGVHEHIHNCGKGQFKMTPFFKIKGSNDHSTILSYEDLFIKRYQPELNNSKLGS